jgi:uncharacterized protein YybS (DUF2232 family)
VPNPLPAAVSKDVLVGVALTSFLFLFSVKMPILGFVAAIFMPLPVLFYRTKLGRNAGAVVPVLSAVLILTILGEPSFDVLFFFELLWLGYVISELYEKKLPVEWTVAFAGLAVLGTAFTGVLVYAGSVGKGLVALAAGYVAHNLELTLRLYEQMGMPEDNLQAITRLMPSLQHYLVRVIPALVVASTLFVTWTNILVSRPVLRKSGLAPPDFGPLNRWQSPDQLVWVLIACGGSLLVPNQLFSVIGLNGLLVLAVIYFFQGMAIISFFFQAKQIPPAIRVMLYGMIALQQMLLLAVIGLGLFDMWLDFRKLNPSGDPAPPDGPGPSDGA